MIATSVIRIAATGVRRALERPIRRGRMWSRLIASGYRDALRMPALETLENARSAANVMTMTPVRPANCPADAAIGVRLPANSAGGIVPVMTKIASP